jgi:hypothetical protein
MVRHWGLTPIIVATQEAEIRKIAVQSHPWQIVLRILISEKKKNIKKWASVVAQGYRP